MSYDAKIICDSLASNGKRLTTFEITYPKFVHNELMTHRLFSRNTASSRAIPYAKTRAQVKDDPVVPVWWGKNQPGMQAKEELTGQAKHDAMVAWLSARDSAIMHADALLASGLHKHLVNRVVEPWMWITAIVTATEWANFFHLRCHADAQPEIQKIAIMMRDLYLAARPEQRDVGDWHLPYIRLEDTAELYGKYGGDARKTLSALCKISTARCARVSYLTQDGRRSHSDDLTLFERLRTSGHWSPFEHVAQATRQAIRTEGTGNFIGWNQYRKLFLDEYLSVYELPAAERRRLVTRQLEEWISASQPRPPLRLALDQKKVYCFTCHTPDGKPWSGVFFGNEAAPLPEDPRPPFFIAEGRQPLPWQPQAEGDAQDTESPGDASPVFVVRLEE